MRFRGLVFLALLGAASAAFGQQKDFALTMPPASYAGEGAHVVTPLLVSSNDAAGEREPFVVRMTVPPELEVISSCAVDDFDPAARVYTWSSAIQGPGAGSSFCMLTFRVAPTVPLGWTYTLTATLTTTSPDSNPFNNTATANVYVAIGSDIVLELSADATQARPGATIAYTIKVTNRGPAAGQSVIVTDTLPSEAEFISFEQLDGPPTVIDTAPKPLGSARVVRTNTGIINSGSSATFRLLVRVKPSVETARLENRASAQSFSADFFPLNNSASWTVLAGPRADLGVAETVGAETAGGRIPITLYVSNDGPDAVSNVKLRNYLQGRESLGSFLDHAGFASAVPSQGTCSPAEPLEVITSPPLPPSIWRLDCNLGAMAPGAGATIVLVVERDAQVRRFSHFVYLEPDQNDPRAGNNSAEVVFEKIAPRKRTTKR